MATCDHPSELVYGIAYPGLQRLGVRKDMPVPISRAANKPRPPASSTLQGIEAGEVFHSLIASGNFRPRSRWAAVGAVTFQVLVLVTLVVAPLYRTLPLPKREMVTMLYLQPPAVATGNATKLRAPTAASRSISTARTTGILAPVQKTRETLPPPVGTTSGVIGGVPGGVVGGVPGGVFSEMLNSVPKAPALAKSPVLPTPGKRIRVAARVAEANLIHDVPPQYPPEAGRARIEGTVVLMALIDKDGSVKDVRVESGLPLLAQAAIDAVKQWRYKPYLIDGEPVEVDSRITINFTLSGA
jgi:periplasmic protein TonB